MDKAASSLGVKKELEAKRDQKREKFFEDLVKRFPQHFLNEAIDQRLLWRRRSPILWRGLDPSPAFEAEVVAGVSFSFVGVALAEGTSGKRASTMEKVTTGKGYSKAGRPHDALKGCTGTKQESVFRLKGKGKGKQIGSAETGEGNGNPRGRGSRTGLESMAEHFFAVDPWYVSSEFAAFYSMAQGKMAYTCCLLLTDPRGLFLLRN